MLKYTYREREALQKQDFFSEFQAAALKAVDSIMFFDQKDQSHNSPKLLLGRSFCLPVLVDISQQDNDKRGKDQR